MTGPPLARGALNGGFTFHDRGGPYGRTKGAKLIPDAYDLAIPRATRKPATRGAIRWHHFDRDTFDLGREPYPIPGTDLTIGIYTPERCIADAFRLRGSIGYETACEALRTWLARGGQPARLAVLARQLPRATGPPMNALELLA